MTQEEKELLLKDLCARLPYRVKGIYILGDTIWSEKPETIVNIDLQKEKIWTNDIVQGYNIEDQDFKPYLRPMSSMTEEEAEEYNDLVNELSNYDCQPEQSASKMIDWFNDHHFDYRGLIEKGLAIEAPKDLYSNESEYDENGWKDLGNGLKVNRLGNVKLTEKERKRLEDSMYDENGWKDLGNGLKMDKDGHIAGGLKLK